MILACAIAAIFAVLMQSVAKKFFDPRQYGYLRDLFLAAAWMLLAIWFAPPQARFVVGAAFLAGIVGLAENMWPEKPVRVGYLLIGFLCALFGPTISFIRFADEGHIYLHYWTSMIVTTLWFAVFPVILQQLDRISGLVGHMLAVTFSLMLIAVTFASSGLEDAFFLAFSGLVLLGAFWSRFSNFYRRAGNPMAAMWGVLVAGTAIMGVSKGIVFSSLLYLSFGLFAIPFVSASLYMASLALPGSVYDTENFYRKLIRSGLDHPSSVRVIAGLCALLGTLTAFLQTPDTRFAAWVWGAVAALALLVIAVPFVSGLKSGPMTHSKPRLWGVKIDNMSLNYALARGRGMILSPGGTRLISTVNALAMEEAVRNPEYHRILKRSAMVLSDGTGLLWGLRFLGMPIQERVTGIDFAEQLCRMAAAERWPVYFLGAGGKTAIECAVTMRARYPGLVVAGARDGYFDIRDPSVADDVANSGAKILLVAMGIPRQEKWVARHAARLGDILAVGVGGAFDVLSGNLERAPRLMQKTGLEWLFRMYQEPHRWKKNLGLITFVLRVLATRIGLYKWKESRKPSLR